MLKEKFERGDMVVYFDQPVKEYKTKEEMLDAIYALGSVFEYNNANNVKVEIYDVDKYGYLIKDYVQSDESHLIHTYMLEKFSDAINRYWNKKEVGGLSE